MKEYKEEITLNKNNRGCYILDTVKGCSVTRKEKPNGCYGDCYAKNIASRYKYNFTRPVKRDFIRDTEQLFLFDFQDEKHSNQIIRKLEKIDMPFIRIGEMGDPSENWSHTLNICEIISFSKIPIVIVTKHWKAIPENLLTDVKKLNIYIHTSISALDNDYEISYRLYQYNRLKKYCNSILRIVSCDFNAKNHEGKIRAKIQKELFKNEDTIDTIFRPSKKNPLVINNILDTRKIKFLDSHVLASVYNENTYFGHCYKCSDMCGVKI